MPTRFRRAPCCRVEQTAVAAGRTLPGFIGGTGHDARRRLQHAVCGRLRPETVELLRGPQIAHGLQVRDGDHGNAQQAIVAAGRDACAPNPDPPAGLRLRGGMWSDAARRPAIPRRGARRGDRDRGGRGGSDGPRRFRADGGPQLARGPAGRAEKRSGRGGDGGGDRDEAPAAGDAGRRFAAGPRTDCPDPCRAEPRASGRQAAGQGQGDAHGFGHAAPRTGCRRRGRQSGPRRHPALAALSGFRKLRRARRGRRRRRG